MRLFLIFLSLIIVDLSTAQVKCMVVFTDKDGVSCDAETYFDQKALNRRAKLGINPCNFRDLPVKEDYINKVATLADSIRYTLRWHNAITVKINSNKIVALESLPFVKEIIHFEPKLVLCVANEFSHDGQRYLANAQIERMGGHKFKEQGITGKGIRVAILDAGFPKVDVQDAFEHIRKRNGIVATYDFVKNKEYAYRGHTHGTMVLSNIGGKVDSTNIGMATGAEFLLARTESLIHEGITDEEAWLAAVEWADKNGADIINSSLGYTKRLYMRRDMDGKTSLIARSANLAAKRGILVVNSAGNEGADPDWVTIGSPADADSVLAVGGINPWTNVHTTWSSFGPSSDRRLKPNVSAYGHAMVVGKNGIQEVTGTSFASPLTAGFAACAWQFDSTLTNMELFKRIEEAGDLYPYYDYAHGYGVPQAEHILKTRDMVDSTFSVSVQKNKIKVTINKEDFSKAILHMAQYYSASDVDSEFTKKFNGDVVQKNSKAFIHINDYGYSSLTSGIHTSPPEYFYYHIQNKEGYLDIYYVLTVEKPEVLELKVNEEMKGSTIRMYYKGYVKTLELK